MIRFVMFLFVGLACFAGVFVVPSSWYGGDGSDGAVVWTMQAPWFHGLAKCVVAPKGDADIVTLEERERDIILSLRVENKMGLSGGRAFSVDVLHGEVKQSGTVELLFEEKSKWWYVKVQTPDGGVRKKPFEYSRGCRRGEDINYCWYGADDKGFTIKRFFCENDKALLGEADFFVGARVAYKDLTSVDVFFGVGDIRRVEVCSIEAFRKNEKRI